MSKNRSIYPLTWSVTCMRHFMRFPVKERRITIATVCTILRIILIPFLIVLMLKNCWHEALLLFSGAAATDFLDGNIARFCNEQTALGALLDPVADKLLINSILFVFFLNPKIGSLLPITFFLCMLFKDIFICCGTLFLYWMGCLRMIQPTLLGKATVAVQMGFIWALLWTYSYGGNVEALQPYAWALVGLVVMACLQYTFKGVGLIMMPLSSRRSGIL